jgi:hypothetical protein
MNLYGYPTMGNSWQRWRSPRRDFSHAPHSLLNRHRPRWSSDAYNHDLAFTGCGRLERRGRENRDIRFIVEDTKGSLEKLSNGRQISVRKARGPVHRSHGSSVAAKQATQTIPINLRLSAIGTNRPGRWIWLVKNNVTGLLPSAQLMGKRLEV